MTQLEKLKVLLPEAQSEDALLEVYLEMAKDIITEIRHSDVVEPEYLNLQLKMAVEFYSKRGAEGQTSHSENGIGRTYDKTDVSTGLLEQIRPYVRTPYSTRRTIV